MADAKKKDEEKEEKKEGEVAEAPKKGKKKLIIIVLVVLLLAGGGGASMTLMGGAKTDAAGAAEEEEKAKEEEEHFERVDLDTFIVNLSENASFLKVKIALEVNAKALSGAGKEGGEEKGGHEGGEGKGGLPGLLGTREPMMKDAVIRVLSSKTAADVLSIEGKDALKEELLDAINEACASDEPVVNAVYFTDFIIQ